MDAPTPDAPKPYKRRHTAAQRVVLGVNITVVIACLASAGGLLYAKRQADLRLQTPKVAIVTSTSFSNGITTVAVTAAGDSSTTTPATFPKADPAAQNFLITGSDANACVTPGSPWAGAADPARDNIGSRSDTIMVMRVDPVLKQAAILSFPRDLWVSIPGRGKQRINAAYVRNDYSLLAQTIYNNFGVVVDHYLQIDFCAFKRIVDAVGGVGIPFDFNAFPKKAVAIRDFHTGINITRSGCHVMHGDEALAYARSRHLGWIDQQGNFHEDRFSDFSRISRQQDFLRRVLQTALAKGLFNPTVAQALIKSLQTDIVTESGFTITDMMKFAGVMRDVQPKGIRTYQIEAGGMIVSGQSVLQPYIDGPNMKAILAIFQGKAPLAGAPTQVISTNTTIGGVFGGTTTSVTSTTSPVTPTTKGGSTTTVTQPAEIIKGDIIPPRTMTCA